MESGQAVQGQVGHDDWNLEHPGTQAGGEPTGAALLEGDFSVNTAAVQQYSSTEQKNCNGSRFLCFVALLPNRRFDHPTASV